MAEGKLFVDRKPTGAGFFSEPAPGAFSAVFLTPHIIGRPGELF